MSTPEEKREYFRLAMQKSRRNAKLHPKEPMVSFEEELKSKFTAGDVRLAHACLRKGMKQGNIKAAEQVLRITGADKQEEQKIGLSTADRQSLISELLEGLKNEARTVGLCPVCGGRKVLCQEPRLVAERQQSEGGEVAAVAVPA